MTYNGNAYNKASTGNTEATLKYYDAAGAEIAAPTAAGSYKVVMTFGDKSVEQTFSITAHDITGKVTLPSLAFNGQEQAAPVETITVDGLTLRRNEDYTVDGTLVGTGSAEADQSFEVTITAKEGGNFSGTATVSWTITHPTGVPNSVTETGSSTGGTVAGNVLTTGADTTKLVALEDNKWAAGLAISWAEGAITEVGDVRVTIDGTTYTGTQIAAGEVAGLAFAADTINTLVWTPSFTLDEAKAAIGGNPLEFTMSLFAFGGTNGGSGLAPVTYTVKVPLTEESVLNGPDGLQVWPPHTHAYTYTGADTDTLTATCDKTAEQGCPFPTLTVGFAGETSKTFDRQPLVLTLTGIDRFEEQTKGSVGAIWYEGENLVEGQPVNAGTYCAKATISAGGQDYTIVKQLTIEQAEIDAVTLSGTTSYVFDGGDKTATIGSVTSKNGLTLETDEWELDASSDALTQKGTASSDTTYNVFVKGTGNFTGVNATPATWAITAPTGAAFTGSMSAPSGCSTSGNTATLSDSSKLGYANGIWTATLTVTMPAPVKTDYTWTDYGTVSYYRADLVRIAVGETVSAGNDLANGLKGTTANDTYSHSLSIGGTKSFTYFSEFSYTVSLTADEVRAAVADGKTSLEFPVTVWANAAADDGDNSTQKHPALAATTFTLVVPLNTLKLYGDYGNLEYDCDYAANGGAHPYVAQVNGQKKYDTLAEALAAADSGETVALIAEDTVGGTLTVPAGVTLNLGELGHAEANYKLGAGAHGAAIVNSSDDLAGRVGVAEGVTGRGVEASGEAGAFSYTLVVVHEHSWSFEAVGNALTATCAGDENCPLHNQAVYRLIATDAVWSGAQVKATTENGFDFDKEVRGFDYNATSNALYYAVDRDGNEGEGTTVPPSAPGNYIVRKVVKARPTSDDTYVEYVLETSFKITAAEYTDGFVVHARRDGNDHSLDTRFGSLSDAINAAAAGDTVYYHGIADDGTINNEIDIRTPAFSSGKDITIDLCGKTFKHAANETMKIYNRGSGMVTLVNGTIQQPRSTGLGGTANQIEIHGESNGGGITFGKGITFDCIATGYSYLTVTVKETIAAVCITDGSYEAAFSEATKGSLTITGGTFKNRNDNDTGTAHNPSDYVPEKGDKYVVRDTTSGRYHTYTVLPHTHVWTATASGNVLTVTCDGADSDLCNYGAGKPVVFTATLKLPENKIADGQPAKAEVEYTDAFPAEMKAAGVAYFDVVEGEQVPREGEPTEKGVYAAAVTIGGQTVSGQFTIWHDGEHAYNYELDEAAGKVTAKCTLEPCAEGNKEYVVTLTVSDKAYDGTPCEATAEGATFFPGEVSALAYYKDEDKLDGAPVNAGTYAVEMVVTPAGGDAGSAMTVRKTFEITRAEATVTPDAASKFVGTADPKFTATVTGLAEGDELVYTVSRTNAAETVGAYDLIASGEAVQGNYTVTYVDAVQAFEIKAGRVILNGVGTDDVEAAFASLGTDGGSLVFNEAITEGACTFAAATSLTVADGAWFVTNDLTIAETTVANDISVAQKLTLEGAVTVGSDDHEATLAFGSIDVGDYKLTLTMNGVVRSAEQLTIENVFAEVEHFEVVENEIEGGYEYTLEASEFKVNYYDNDGETVVHTDTATILDYTKLTIWDGEREGLVLLGYKKENGEALEQSDAALHAYIADEAAAEGCDGVVKVFGTWEKPTITITIAKGTGVADVQTNGVSVVGELELPAEAKTVELTLVKDTALVIPVYKVITNDVTNVTQRVATYAVVEGLTYTFIAEEAKADDPDVSDKDVADAIIDAIDPGPSHDDAVAKVEAVTGGDEPKVAPKELAAWITDRSIQSVDIAASDYLAASVKLDTPKPITEETEVKVETFENVSAEGFELSIAIKIDSEATPEVVKAAKEKIVGYIQAVDALGDEFGPVAASRVEIDTTTGKVTITPAEGKTSEFFKIVIPKDK